MGTTGKTVLGQPETPEQRKIREQHEWEIARLHAVTVGGLLDGYRKGQVSFYSMCRAVAAAVDAAGLGEFARERWLGAIVSQALKNPPLKEGRKNGFPESLKVAAAHLVDTVAQREGLSKKPSRGEPKTASAFDRVASVFADAGIRITERNVEEWYTEFRFNP